MSPADLASLLSALDAAAGYPWRLHTVNGAELRAAPDGRYAPEGTPRVSVACEIRDDLPGRRRVVVRWRGRVACSPVIRTEHRDILDGPGWAERAASAVVEMLAEEVEP